MPLPGLRWRGPLVAVGGGRRRVLAPVVPAAGHWARQRRRCRSSFWRSSCRRGQAACPQASSPRPLGRGRYLAFFPHPHGLLSLSTADVFRVACSWSSGRLQRDERVAAAGRGARDATNARGCRRSRKVVRAALLRPPRSSANSSSAWPITCPVILAHVGPRPSLQVREQGQRRPLRPAAGADGRAQDRRVPRPGAHARDRAVHRPRDGGGAGRVRDDATRSPRPGNQRMQCTYIPRARRGTAGWSAGSPRSSTSRPCARPKRS